MPVALVSSRQNVTFRTASGRQFVSNTFGQTVAAAAQALPRISVPAQRMMQMPMLDLQGLTADSVEWFNNGVSLGATAPMLPMGGLIHAEVTSGETTYATPIIRTLHNHADPSHTAMVDAVVALIPHPDATHIAVADGPWTDPATWDVQTVPGEGAVVLVPIGRTVTYDSDTPFRLDRVRVDGTLTWALDQSTDMLVETITVTPGAEMVIGSGLNDRLPEQHTATITIGNRSYRIDPDTPTDLDLANDPELIGRGLLGLGQVTIYGAACQAAINTAPFNLPLAGDTSVTLKDVPATWRVGGTIVIPASILELDANGVSIPHDEERVITDIAGSVVSWDAGQPLLWNHDHHNSEITVIEDMQIPIIYKDRNVILQSEAGGTIAQRGHSMFMHGGNVDIWSLKTFRVGRTDKSIPAGEIDGNGDFKYYDDDLDEFATVPLTADANLASRYSVHLHMLGFNKPGNPLLQDCFVEKAAGWGIVHHGCRADMIACVVYDYLGAGVVAESGDEMGQWSGLVVAGLRTTIGTNQAVKGAEEPQGLRGGNVFKNGYAFAYSGRAMVVVNCVGIASVFGHGFYHRGTRIGGGPFDLERVNMDVNDLQLQFGNATVSHQDHPIIHFNGNIAIGCATGLGIVKAGASQGHDLNIRIRNFLAWGTTKTGVGLNYIGGYLVANSRAYGASVDDSGNKKSPSAGFGGGKNNQIAWVDLLADGFDRGLSIQGSDNQGADNSKFSQTDPRFMIGGTNDFTGCNTEIEYTGDNSGVTTQSITKIITDPIDPTARPVITAPFIFADADLGARTVTYFPATKADQVATSVDFTPKAWDSVFQLGNTFWRDMRALLSDYGYWTYTDGDGTHNIILIPWYWSDRANAMSIKTMNAVKVTDADVVGYTNNGTFERSTADPTATDITRNVTTGVEDSFNVLTEAGAMGETGTTLTLNIPELAAGLGTDKPAHFKPDFGNITINANGDVTYTSVPGFVGTDEMLAYVYDGKGRFCTVLITFNVTAP